MDRQRAFEVVETACNTLRARYRRLWETARDSEERETLWLKLQVVREVERELSLAEPEATGLRANEPQGRVLSGLRQESASLETQVPLIRRVE